MKIVLFLIITIIIINFYTSELFSCINKTFFEGSLVAYMLHELIQITFCKTVSKNIFGKKCRLCHFSWIIKHRYVARFDFELFGYTLDRYLELAASDKQSKADLAWCLRSPHSPLGYAWQTILHLICT